MSKLVDDFFLYKSTDLKEYCFIIYSSSFLNQLLFVFWEWDDKITT
ncbi:MotA/TolQ/ExbB proton channel [Streptococcus sanguinis SK49]|uniref:MotA/TolQ/ExbB proton channel n=1 Tax=Streptococcus sanguinis SK49 TaxID=888808 RepID=F3UZ03_STRSA|nr:MotA/TolQ/ExbB proton channel [Streptococcus sanguinis SK49]